MKKEKRELTIEQLEKKAKVAAKIVSVAVITYLFSLILIMVLFNNQPYKLKKSI